MHLVVNLKQNPIGSAEAVPTCPFHNQFKPHSFLTHPCAHRLIYSYILYDTNVIFRDGWGGGALGPERYPTILPIPSHSLTQKHVLSIDIGNHHIYATKEHDYLKIYYNLLRSMEYMLTFSLPPTLGTSMLGHPHPTRCHTPPV